MSGETRMLMDMLFWLRPRDFLSWVLGELSMDVGSESGVGCGVVGCGKDKQQEAFENHAGETTFFSTEIYIKL